MGMRSGGIDECFKNMDFPIRHWNPFPRRFPFPFPVATAAFLPAKENWIRRAFPTCNFSFILHGRGDFFRKGQHYVVEAPCVITQWPGEFVEYGPTPPNGTWTELYLIYSSRMMKPFEKAGLIDTGRPVWPIQSLPTIKALVEELHQLTHSSTPEDTVDRVDRVCERLIFEASLTRQADAPGLHTARAVAESFRVDLRQSFDLEQTARQHGMSTATFRRRWAEFSPISPHRYLEQLRLSEACRLLAETAHPIKSIAQAVGFDDEFYFSRRFQASYLMAPRAYRKIHLLQQRPPEP